MLSPYIDPYRFYTPYTEQILSLSSRRAAGDADDRTRLAFSLPRYYHTETGVGLAGASYPRESTLIGQLSTASRPSRISLAEEASRPRHTVMEGPTGQRIKRELDLPLQEHSSTDFMKAALGFSKRLIKFPRATIKLENRVAHKILQSLFDMDTTSLAMEHLESMAKNFHLSDRIAVPETVKERIRTSPTLTMAAGLFLSFPALIRIGNALQRHLQNQSAVEAKERAHSHQTLESPTGQHIKDVLDLPYQQHSKFDYPAVAKFFEKLTERYPELMGPVRSIGRDLFKGRTTLLKRISQWKNSETDIFGVNPGRILRMTARTLLYAEGINRRWDFVRHFSPLPVLVRMLRAAVGADEERWAELALSKLGDTELSREDRRVIKLLGLGLGAIEAGHVFGTAYTNINHFFTHNVSGPYEDQDQEAVDRRRSQAIKEWRAGHGRYSPADPDGGLLEDIGDEFRDSIKPEHLLGHATHILTHPGQHIGQWLGVLGYAAVGAGQLYKAKQEIWSGEEDWLGRAAETLLKGHMYRSWAFFGTMGTYGALTAHSWANRLSSFGGLTAAITSDTVANIITDNLYKHDWFKRRLSSTLHKGVDYLQSYLEYEKPPVWLNKYKEVANKLDESMSARVESRAITNIGLSSLERETLGLLRTLGQETYGGLIIEPVLWTLSSALLRKVGRSIDRGTARVHAQHMISKVVAVQKQDKEEDSRQKKAELSQKARLIKEARSGQGIAPRRRRQSAPEVRSIETQEDQQQQPTVSVPSAQVNIQHVHEDVGLNLHMINQAHSMLLRRGYTGATISYSDYHAFS